MTFISAIKASKGIVVAADGLELRQGGTILWQHFDEILKAKSLSEDDTTDKISPAELKEKFKTYGEEIGNRIVSFDVAKKLFKITNNSCLQIAGMADLNNKTVDVLVGEAVLAIETSGNLSYSNCESIIKKTFEDNLRADASNNMTTELIYSGINEATTLFEFSHIKWEKDWVRDDSNRPQRDASGNVVQDWFFRKVNHPSAWFCIAGWINYLDDFDKINHTIKTPITLEHAFDLSKNLMDLVITVERISNRIPGVGGTIRYGVVAAGGFKYIDGRTDVLNIT